MAPLDNASPEAIDLARQEVRQHFEKFPFFKLLGIELLEIEPGRARLALSFRPDLTQPAGIMHGGVIAALVDTAIAHSILLTKPYLDNKPHGGRMAAVDLRTRYLRPVSGGKVYCDARVDRLGRQIIHTSAVVTDEEGKQVALGESIYMLVLPEQLRKKAAAS